MYRTRGKVFGVVAAIAVSGLLAACGDEESTATSTPTLSSAATSAPQSASSVPEAPAPEGEAPAPPEGESAGEPPAEPERPAPLPPQESPDSAPVGDKEQQFLDELGKQGVSPASPEIALNIGNYVCQGLAQGVSREEMTTFVNAMAGSDPSFDPSKMPVEQAGKIYIDTAEQHYCQ